MSEIKSFEDVKQELVRQLNRLEFEKELWEKVEIIGTKEDIHESLRNVTVKNAKLFGLEESRPVITVSGHNPKNDCDEEYSIWLFWKEDGELEVCDSISAHSFIYTRILNIRIAIAKCEKEIEDMGKSDN